MGNKCLGTEAKDDDARGMECDTSSSFEDIAPSPSHDKRSARMDDITTVSKRRNKIKVLGAMLLGVVFGSLGNITLSHGMRCVGESGFECAHDAVVGAVTQPYFLVGVSLMFAFLLLYLASLSWEDLSYVMPLTAGEYVLVTLLAFVVLHESVTPLRWAGSVLVATGIILVARS